MVVVDVIRVVIVVAGGSSCDSSGNMVAGGGSWDTSGDCCGTRGNIGGW